MRTREADGVASTPPSSNRSLNTCACTSSCASTAAATTAAVCFARASFFALDVGEEGATFAGVEDNAEADRFEVRCLFIVLLEAVGRTFVAEEDMAELSLVGEFAAAMRSERRGARAFFGAVSSSSVSASARDENVDVIGRRDVAEVTFAFFTTPSATRALPPFWTLDNDEGSTGIVGTGESTVVVIVVAIYFWDAFAPTVPFLLPFAFGASSDESGRPVTGSRFSLSSIVTVLTFVAMILAVVAANVKFRALLRGT